MLFRSFIEEIANGEVAKATQESAINALKLKMSNTGLTIEQEAKVEEETKRQRFKKARGLL